jgi:hypothetical protein
MLFYYKEENPAACVAPDVFVVQGVSKGERRTYKLWEQGQPPCAPGDQGQLIGQALSFELWGQNGQLQVVNSATGERLLTPAEVHAARRTEAEA